MDKFKLYYTGPGEHATGRGAAPTLFRAWGDDPEDPKPHALVSRPFGDMLIEQEGRYEWAEPKAPKARKAGS